MSLFSLMFKFFPRTIKDYIKFNIGILDHSTLLKKPKTDNQGEFSELARNIYPNSKILMIEPNENYIEMLKHKALRPGISFCNALLSDSTVPVYFKKDGTNSSVVLFNDEESVVEINPKLLDDIFFDNSMKGPVLIKIDVQGHEMNVLRGAIHVLKITEVVILEISLIPLHVLAPEPSEIINFFKKEGFRLYDIFGFNRRPCNKDLWQVDWVFVKNDSILGEPKLGW